jgi:hypothetical protein
MQVTRTRVIGIAAAWLVAITVAACGGSTPPAASGQPTTAASSAPGSSAGPADDAAAAAALTAFGALTQRKDLAYNLGQQATIEVDGAQLLDATYALDVNGSEFEGTIDSIGQKVDLVYTGGTAYTRSGEAAWATGSLDDATVAEIVSPWQYLGKLEDLRFDGVDPAGYRYANSGPIPYQTSGMKAQGLSGTIDKLTLVLAKDGTPVSFVIDASAKPTTGVLKDKAVHLVTTVAFDKFGQPVTIAKPE